jgi:hypothetical protein
LKFYDPKEHRLTYSYARDSTSNKLLKPTLREDRQRTFSSLGKSKFCVSRKTKAYSSGSGPIRTSEIYQNTLHFHIIGCRCVPNATEPYTPSRWVLHIHIFQGLDREKEILLFKTGPGLNRTGKICGFIALTAATADEFHALTSLIHLSAKSFTFMSLVAQD